MTEDPRKTVERYKQEGAHLLNEPRDFFAVETGPFKCVFNELRLNTQGPFPNGHIYEGTKGYGDNPTRYRLSGAALEELGRCVNIAWSPVETRIIHRDADSVIAQAMGALRLPDGSMAISSPQKYEFSLSAKRENLRLQRFRNRKGDSRTKNLDDAGFAAFLESYLAEEVAKERAFMVTKAETGAKNRVIRKMLPLKGEYTLAELKRPFVGVQVVLQPDYTDPRLREQLTSVFVASVAGSFGLPLPAPSAPPRVMNEVTGHVVDITPGSAQEPPPSEPVPTDGGLSDQDKVQIELSNYREQGGREERLKWISRLMDETRYDRAKLGKPLSSYDDEKLEQFFVRLIEQKVTGRKATGGDR